jgi:hypothetical protein
MLKHEFLDSIPLYAMDALSGTEKEQMRAHLQNGCDICEPELRLFQETESRLPYSLPNVPLPAELKEKTWNRIQQETQRVEQKSSWSILSAVAVLILALTAGWWIWQTNRELQQSNRELVELRSLLNEQKKEIEWLRDPSVQLALLSGLDPLSKAKGKMLWNQQVSRGMFYVNLLPPVSAEKNYQLWVIGDRGPVSAGVFYPNPQGSAVVTITRIDGPAQGALQFAVTIEPRGGVPQPTGTMVLAGKSL